MGIKDDQIIELALDDENIKYKNPLSLVKCFVVINILCEPFVLKGSATEEKYEEFCEVKKYAAVVKKLAEEYGVPFVALQEKFDEAAEKHGAIHYLYDGVHPDVAGGKLIAEEWLKVFRKEF